MSLLTEVRTTLLTSPGSYGLDIDIHEDPRRALSGFIKQYGKSAGWDRYMAEVRHTNKALSAAGFPTPTPHIFYWEITFRDPISGFGVTKARATGSDPYQALDNLIKRSGYRFRASEVLKRAVGTSWWSLM